MPSKYSKFGRLRVMSKKAEHFICDHSLIFFSSGIRNFRKPSEFKFIMAHLVDTDDKHKYEKSEDDEEDQDIPHSQSR